MRDLTKKSALLAAFLLGMTGGGFANNLNARADGIQTLDVAEQFSISVSNILLHACYTTMGLGQEEIDITLAEIASVDAGIDALKNGDEARGILPAKAHGVRRAIARFEDDWANYSGFARVAARGELPKPYLKSLHQHYKKALDSAEGVFKRTAKVYSLHRVTPFQSGTLSNLTHIAAEGGLIAADHCLISLGIDVDQAKEEIRIAKADVIDRLDLAIRGDDMRKVLPAPNSVTDELTCVQVDFEVLREHVEPVVDDGVIPTVDDVLALRAYANDMHDSAIAALHAAEAHLADRPAPAGHCALS
ncbi:MAG: hypothetical protein AAFQ33_10555 [Pseudomonadota bacterium]